MSRAFRGGEKDPKDPNPSPQGSYRAAIEERPISDLDSKWLSGQSGGYQAIWVLPG